MKREKACTSLLSRSEALHPSGFPFVLSVESANGLQASSATPIIPRRSQLFDPMVHGRRAQQRKGMIETTVAGINPRDSNYGDVVGKCR